MRMEFVRKLPIPMECKEMYPLNADLAQIVSERAVEMKRIFTGESNKLLLIIGPCSADREDSVMEYLTRLRGVADKVADKIFIVPRIYTNKPRTTGAGYKGMLHQPDPEAKPDLYKGIVAIRQLHMRALAETGFSAADEMLYPENYKYLDDVLAYVGHPELRRGRRAFRREPGTSSRGKCRRWPGGHEESYGGQPVCHDECHLRRSAGTLLHLSRLGRPFDRQSARARHLARLPEQAR